jgi:hypothetical protein
MNFYADRPDDWSKMQTRVLTKLPFPFVSIHALSLPAVFLFVFMLCGL